MHCRLRSVKGDSTATPSSPESSLASLCRAAFQTSLTTSTQSKSSPSSTPRPHSTRTLSTPRAHPPAPHPHANINTSRPRHPLLRRWTQARHSLGSRLLQYPCKSAQQLVQTLPYSYLSLSRSAWQCYDVRSLRGKLMTWEANSEVKREDAKPGPGRFSMPG